MSNFGMLRDSADACPSCSTRLRISLETADKSQFECPECGVALVAHQQSDGTIQIAEFSAILSEVSSHGVDFPRSVRVTFPRSVSELPGGSRTVAAAVTLIVGILLLTFLLPGGTDSKHVGPDPDAAAADHHNNDVDPSDAESSALAANSADSLPTETHDAKPPPLIEAPVDASHAAVIADSLPVPGGNDVNVASGTAAAENHQSKITNAVGEQAKEPDAAEITKPASAAQPAAKPMSVRERLDISIRSFRQTKPIPLRDVIRIVERMCRVRVDISATSPEQLDKQITVSLQQTTPADILAEAGRNSGLRVIVEGASVRMISAPE
jgi:predicted RNA-binding Zn-ribbon protein involved in translation (DUF1610 family)